MFRDNGDVQRVVGFRPGDRIGDLLMEPRHVLVEKYFRYEKLFSFFLQI